MCSQVFKVFNLNMLNELKGVNMSAEAAAFTRSWPVGGRMCHMTLPHPRPGEAIHAAFEWTPTAPRALSADEWCQYRAGRDAALAEVGRALGISVAVVEL
jgi:hypothetical protein